MASYGDRRSTSPAPEEALGAALERLGTGISTLVRDHLELAKVEARLGARSWALQGSVLLAAASLIGVGYLMLMVGLAMGFASRMPAWLAFSGVGVANALAGGAFLKRLLARLAATRSDDRA